VNVFFDLLKVVLPATITSICTFFITKYTYNRNTPLNKLEIVYNEVYYPLYKLINNETNIDFIISKMKPYFDKYDKYIDRSTLKIFDTLCQCNTNSRKKSIFQKFKSNIYSRSYYLRRRLGYLEPGLQMYKFCTASEKSTIRIAIEFFGIYISLVVISVTSYNIQIIFTAIFLLLFMTMIIEIICKFIKFVYYKIRK